MVLTQYQSEYAIQWIGLRENFNRKAPYLMGKSMVSGFDFPLNQSIEQRNVMGKYHWRTSCFCTFRHPVFVELPHPLMFYTEKNSRLKGLILKVSINPHIYIDIIYIIYLLYIYYISIIYIIYTYIYIHIYILYLYYIYIIYASIYIYIINLY